MIILAVFCAHAVLMIGAVLVVGRKPVRWAAAALFLAGCFWLEWLAPVGVTWHALLAFGGLMALLGTVAVAASARAQASAWLRLLYLVTWGYRLRAGQTRPMVSLALMGRLIVEALAMGAACLALGQIVHTQLSVAGAALCRLFAGIVFIYALSAFITDLMRFGFLASGTAMRPILVTPVAARSLRDFWGKRWNLAMSAWLYRFIFLPLARRHHPNLGLVCAFLVSAAMHAWLPLAALGTSTALSLGAFFCLQGVFVLIEDRLHVPAWPVPLARLWTVAILVATSPLIIYPYLSLLHL